MSSPLLNGKRHPGRSGQEWNKVRSQVLASSQVCWRCGREIDLNADPKSKWSPTIDHLYELKNMRHLSPAEQKRLALDPALLRPAHRVCNSRRSAGRGTAWGTHSPRSREW